MARVLGLFGFTGGFLVVSPGLRQSLIDAVSIGSSFIQSHGPYSYIGLGVVGMGAVTLILASGSNPR